MMLYTLAAILAICILWYLLIYPLSFWKRKGVKQPPQSWPILGNAWLYLFNIMRIPVFTQYLYDFFSNDRYFGFYNLTRPVVVVRDPELLKKITIKDFEHFSDHAPFVGPETDSLWSNAVLNLRGQKWKEMRNTMTPAFSSSKIRNTYLLMLETAKSFMEYFEQKQEDLFEVELKNIFSRFANDVIATTAFGVKVDSLKDEDCVFYKMGKKVSDLSGFLFVVKVFIMQALPGLANILGFKVFHEESAQYLQGVVNDAIKYREENHVVRPDMINMLLEARKGQQEKNKNLHGISNDEIASQSLIFLTAGIDTVSSAMTFGSYELAMNRDIQDQLRDEIREIGETCNGDITYDILMSMKYMDMFISETLRKWPPFIFNDRICTKPYIIEPVKESEKPVLIPEGTELWIFIYAIHRDPKFWPEPEKFDPERFSPENKANIEPCTYAPFGFGPRLCIGNRFAMVEIKAMFFHLLSKYEIVPMEKTPKKIVLQNSFSTESDTSIHVGFKLIKN